MTGALIVTGSGDCFYAGLDLKPVPEYSAAQQRELIAALNRLFTRIYGLPCTTIAGINSRALAGGHFLASCDVLADLQLSARDRATHPALASALHGFATGPRNTGGSPVVLIDIF